MANGASGSSNGFLYFVIGALVVAVLGFGVYSYQRSQESPTDRAIHNAADAVAGAADSVSRHN